MDTFRSATDLFVMLPHVCQLQKFKDDYNFMLLRACFTFLLEHHLLIETFASHRQIPCIPGTEGKKLEIAEKS